MYDFLIKTVNEAGELVLKLRDEGFKSDFKEGDVRNIVTSVDNDVNDFIINKIKEAYPKHNIHSEEGGNINEGGEYLWTIDPIDGTANFSRGIPHYSVCIGLLKNGVPIIGAVYNPVTKELFSFEKGKGAFLNGKEIRVSTVEDLSKTHVNFHTGRKEELREWGGESYKRLMGNVKKTVNLSSSALDTCFVAAGRLEISIYGTLSLLDISSAYGILLEAGGVVSDEKGNSIGLSKDPETIFIANNEKILKAVIELL